MENLFKNKTVLELIKLIKRKKITCEELTRYYLKNIEAFADKNAVLETFPDAIEEAKKYDEMISRDEKVPVLAGIPILIKDNIMYKGKICSCASKILANYVADYNATVIEKLLKAGVVIIGRTNMDEFAMGGSCENSAFGPVKNAYNDLKVSGGSSGGSAVAVALDMCAFALGSDTGGSVRQPASYNGIVGIKPTYGRVSRYGLVAFASSLDTIGLLTKDVKDSAYVMSIIAGKDKKDETSSDVIVPNYLEGITNSIESKTIGIIKEVQELVEKTPYANLYNLVIEKCKIAGAKVKYYSLPEYKHVLSVYYTIAPAEASSNMSRVDSLRFGMSLDADSSFEISKSSRSKLLGKEVKRRIMLGNFVLSSAHYNVYYKKAKSVQALLREKFNKIFKTCDAIFMPTAYGEAFDIGSKTNDPISMYIEDMFTVTANIVGVPAISVPIGRGEQALPIGLQILSRHFNERELYNIASVVEVVSI